jgi:hypothetical protein
VINRSLDETFPNALKTALILPHHKKGNPNPDDFASYRPVSNLPFMSKIAERVVARCLTEFLTSNKLLNPYQHAYKSLHSCETALLVVMNDSLTAIDNGDVLLLVMLDLTAAFDVVN